MRGSDLFSSSFPFIQFLSTNHVSGYEERDIYQKIIKTSHMPMPIIHYMSNTWQLFFLHLKGEELACNEDAFNCSNGIPECIPKTWVCDGHEECTDSSDEAHTVCGKLVMQRNPISKVVALMVWKREEFNETPAISQRTFSILRKY